MSKLRTYARPFEKYDGMGTLLVSGYEYRKGGDYVIGDIELTSEEFELLADEKAQIVNGQVVMNV